MEKNENKIDNYPTTDDYRREDLIKAGKILLYSVISASIITVILYYLPF